MKTIATYLLFVVFIIQACVSRRATEDELPLLPSRQTPKWWIVNTIVQDEKGKDVHVCALFNVESPEGENYASCFVSVYAASDNNYNYALRNSGESSISFKPGFPLSISIPDTDSAKSNWRWQLNRSGMKLETILGKNAAAPTYFDQSVKFTGQDPFRVNKLSGATDVYALNIRNAETGLSGAFQAGSVGPLFIRTFTGRDALLGQARQETVCWIDLQLNSGKQLNLMFRIDDKDVFRTDIAILWEEAGNQQKITDLKIDLIKNEKTVLSSGKSYWLNFSVDLPYKKIAFRVKPRVKDQELKLGRNSFWMGAIETTDTKNGTQTGKGNMYIFKQ